MAYEKVREMLQEITEWNSLPSDYPDSIFEACKLKVANKAWHAENEISELLADYERLLNRPD